jgi:ATP-dependent Clp protease ATP-binding subunit ClpC
MFERYTDRARRVVFFARYEASVTRSPCIETEHLLLGLLRENRPLVERYAQPGGDMEQIRASIRPRQSGRTQVPTSVDIPLSDEAKRALMHAAEEADRLSQRRISTRHLLLALLHPDSGLAARLLEELGLRLDPVRDDIARRQRRKDAPDADAGGPPGNA